MNKKKRGIIIGIISLIGIILLVFIVKFGFTKKPIENIGNLKSENAYVYNLTDEKVEVDINSKEKVAPASLIKIMTVITSLESIDDLSEIAPVDTDSYLEMVEENASMAGFYGNEQTTYLDLLYGTMLASGGECANSLAINISGSNEEFTKKINEKAKEIGMENTFYKNSEGLDEKGQYSTAEDISKSIEYGLKNKDFKSIFTTEKYISTKTLDHPEGVEIESTVLGKLDDYEEKDFKIIGGKSGTTDEAGNCWATLAEKNNKEYIVVVMGSPSDNDRILDTFKIIDEL